MGQRMRPLSEALKEYLARPLILSRPVLGELLYVYLAASKYFVNFVLVREEHKI